MSAKIAASARRRGRSARRAGAAAPPARADPPPDAEFVPGQLLVRFDPGVGKAESDELAADQGGDVIERFGIVPGLALVDLPPGLGVEAAESRFEALGRRLVRPAEPHLPRGAASPTTSSSRRSPNALWGLDNTGQLVPDPNPTLPPADRPALPDRPGRHARRRHRRPRGLGHRDGRPARSTVGVIDSGITLAHEDLADNLWTNPGETPGDVIDDDGNLLVDDVNGWDFVEDDNTPDDASGHGTHVAGAIGAQGNNAIGTTGVVLGREPGRR